MGGLIEGRQTNTPRRYLTLSPAAFIVAHAAALIRTEDDGVAPAFHAKKHPGDSRQ